MFFPFKKTMPMTPNSIVYTDANNNAQFLDITDYLTAGKLLSVYKAIPGNSVTWLYAGSSQSPHFRFALPTGTLTGSDCCFFKGYTPKQSFYSTAGNDKCICTATNYVCVSDFSFNGDLDAWTAYMADKTIYLPMANINQANYTPA